MTDKPKTIEDLIKMIPNKGDTITVNGMKVTNNGTYYGLAGKGIK